MHKPHKNRQQGSALISALLLMSVVTLLAVGMITRQNIEIRRTESIFQQQRLTAQADWAELWAVETLRDVSSQLTAESDYITLEQSWAQPLTEFQQEGLWVSVEITDLQSLFNINNIIVEAATLEEGVTNPPENNNNQNNNNENNNAAENLPPENTANSNAELQLPPVPADFLTKEDVFTPAWMFARLLKNQAGLNAVQSQALTESTLAWLLPEETELDNVYLKLPLPYRAAHQLFFSTSELRLVSGMDNKIYQAIEAYLSALPLSKTPSLNVQNNEIVPINLNTTTKEVLAAILDIAPAQANDILASRPFFNEESWRDQLTKLKKEEDNFGNAEKLLSITSRYFLVRAVIRNERRQFIQYSILYREENNEITVLRRIQSEI